MFLNNQQVTKKNKSEIKKFLETNDNKNRTIQNLWDAAKAILSGKCIAIQSHLKKTRKTSNRQPNFYLKQLEKEEQKNPRISRRK